MDVTKYKFELNGIMPLLMHADDINGADELMEWRKSPKNKNVSKPGDDRSPPWTWLTYLYRHDGLVVMPSENIMAALRTAGAKMILKGQKTFKEATQSGMIIMTDTCEFLSNGDEVVDPRLTMKDGTFPEQLQYAKKNGFELDVRRAKVGQAKHIRVRPRFAKWSVRGEIVTRVPELTPNVVSQLFSLSGAAGLCDWRPSSSKSPGPYGQFEAKVSKA